MLLLLAVIAFGASVGETSIPLPVVLYTLSNNILGTGIPVDAIDAGIVWNYRLSRALVAACCGAVLATSGAVLQSLLRNALADPYLLGISAGASTGAVSVAILGIGGGMVGLAMGAFASLYTRSNDPLLVKLTQLVMTDEAFHHKFGKIWADRTIPKLSEEEHTIVEQWAAECFETLLFNLANIRQRQTIYPKFGLDWEWVRDSVREVYTDRDAQKRKDLKDPSSVMRVLVKTLSNSGIITDRTRPLYANWIDMDDLEQDDVMHIGDAIAADGIEFLKTINADRRVIGQKF